VKIHPQEIERIAAKLLLEWKGQKLVECKAAEPTIQVRITEIILKELRVEEELHKEVERMLAKYEKEFEKGTLDRRKMFQMVKNQLVKERKIIL